MRMSLGLAVKCRPASIFLKWFKEQREQPVRQTDTPGQLQLSAPAYLRQRRVPDQNNDFHFGTIKAEHFDQETFKAVCRSAANAATPLQERAAVSLCGAFSI